MRYHRGFLSGGLPASEIRRQILYGIPARSICGSGLCHAGSQAGAEAGAVCISRCGIPALSGADGSENNSVVLGTEADLRAYAEKDLGYELHPDYLYYEDDFAGDIVKEELQ